MKRFKPHKQLKEIVVARGLETKLITEGNKQVVVLTEKGRSELKKGLEKISKVIPPDSDGKRRVVIIFAKDNKDCQATADAIQQYCEELHFHIHEVKSVCCIAADYYNDQVDLKKSVNLIEEFSEIADTVFMISPHSKCQKNLAIRLASRYLKVSNAASIISEGCIQIISHKACECRD